MQSFVPDWTELVDFAVLDMEHDWMYCVDRLLKSWTGYQLAVRMLSGGPDTYEKAEWFAKVGFHSDLFLLLCTISLI